MATKVLRNIKTYVVEDGEQVNVKEKIEVVKYLLPWVHGIEADAQTIPEGMFGPYPSRPQSMVDAKGQPAHRRHPFAYSPAPHLPFAALDPAKGHRLLDVREDMQASQRPDSKVLSRGVAARAMPRPGTGGTSRETDDSPGMGTFGVGSMIDPARMPLPRSEVAKTQVPSSPGIAPQVYRKIPPSVPLPVPPVAGPPQTKSEYDELHDEIDHSATAHKTHRDPTISHAEAHSKQNEAMERARAAALAHLEAAQQRAMNDVERDILGDIQGIGFRGPRETFETVTSDPSFGHMMIENEFPLAAGHSVQLASMDAPHHEVQDPTHLAGMSNLFLRIPFGVPLGMHIPGSLIVTEDDDRAGLGLSYDQNLFSFLQEDETPRPRHRQDRSAFVETVEDEDSPVGASRTEHTMQSVTASPKLGADLPDHDRAQERSNPAAPSQPHKPPSNRLDKLSISHALPTTKAKHKPSTLQSDAFPRAPVITPQRTGGGIKTSGVGSNTKGGEKATDRTVSSRSTARKAPPSLETIGNGPPLQHPSTDPPTPATSVSNVNQLVADSKFHDETLCQLLDGARLNLIGDQAKKALQRAARARIIELRDLRQQQEIRPHSTTDDPPDWVQEILARLSAFEARFAAVETQRAEATHTDRPATLGSQVAPNIPGHFIDDLIFNNMPSSRSSRVTGMPVLQAQASGQPSAPCGNLDQHGRILNWGSDVELPVGSSHGPSGPDILIRAPTGSATGTPRPIHESGIDQAQSRAVSHFSTVYPRQIAMTVVTEGVLPHAALSDPKDRDLPATPSESNRSHRASSQWVLFSYERDTPY
ncbi:hypothetical protein IAU60_006015 [Kwoniella sp. DSM 27419]